MVPVLSTNGIDELMPMTFSFHFLDFNLRKIFFWEKFGHSDMRNEHGPLGSDNYRTLTGKFFPFQQGGDLSGGLCPPSYQVTGRFWPAEYLVFGNKTNLGIESPVVRVGWFALRTEGYGIGKAQSLESRGHKCGNPCPQRCRFRNRDASPLARVIIAFDEVSVGAGPIHTSQSSPSGTGSFLFGFGLASPISCC